MSFKLVLPILLYLFINSLFVLKYSSRVDSDLGYVFTLLYFCLSLVWIYFFQKTNLKIYYKGSFFLILSFFFLVTIYLNIVVDGYTLNTDRWSAMEAGISALLNGDYPYSAIDHLNGRTSNLPTLLFIGIPFYLIGNIGFLQSFAFLIFAYIIYITFTSYRDRLFCLLLLICSPAYLWEVYAKSDLMSNFIFITLFLVVVQKKITKNQSINTSVLSFLSTALLLTRLTSVIPISLLLFKEFYYFSIKKKLIFITTAVVTALVFLFICFHNADNIEHIKMHNPLELQNRQLPFIVSILFIISPIIYSFKVHNLSELIGSNVFILFITVAIAFILNIFEHGIFQCVFNSAFDISYFNITLPFVILFIALNYKISH